MAQNDAQNVKIERKISISTCRYAQKNKETNRKKTDRQTDKQTDRQKRRKTSRYMDILDVPFLTEVKNKILVPTKITQQEHTKYTNFIETCNVLMWKNISFF